MKNQREQTRQQLKRLQRKPAGNIDKRIKQMADKVWDLAGELQSDTNPARIRELLHQWIDRIELTFTAREQGKRTIYQATGGNVVFQELSGFANRGDWI